MSVLSEGLEYAQLSESTALWQDTVVISLDFSASLNLTFEVHLTIHC